MYFRRVFFFLGLLLLKLNVYSQDVTGFFYNNETTGYLEVADDLMNDGRFFEAVKYYEKALKQRKNRKNPDVLWNLAFSYEKCNKYAKAEEIYEKLNNRFFNQYPLAKWKLARIKYQIGKKEQAIELFEQFIDAVNVEFPQHVGYARRLTSQIQNGFPINQSGKEFRLRRIQFDGINSPSYYGGVFYRDYLWLTSSIEVNSQRKIKLDNVHGVYEHYYVDRLYFAKHQGFGYGAKGKTAENIFYSMDKNYLPPAFDPDLEKIFISICSKEKEPVCNIQSGDFKPNHFISFEEMEAPFNQKGWSAKNPCLVKINGELIIFFSARKLNTEKNGYDLYYSIIEDGNEISEMQNLGKKINTAFNEITPFYDSKSKTLFFSSDGFPGHGGMDVFMVKGDPFSGWGKVKNMGKPLNSEFDDYYYYQNSLGKEKYSGLVSSNRAGDHCCDNIYEIQQIMDDVLLSIRFFDQDTQKPIDSIHLKRFVDQNITPKKSIADAVVDYRLNKDSNYRLFTSKDMYYEDSITLKSLRKDTVIDLLLKRKSILFKGVVIDSNSRLPVNEARIFLINDEQDVYDSISTNDSGTFDMVVEIDELSRIQIKKSDYMYFVSPVKIQEQDIDKRVAERKFPLVPINIGARMVFQNIEFDFNSTKLLLNSRPELNRLAEFLFENPNLELEISGHTDNVGDYEYNKNLSRKRAKSVLEYLVEQGVDKNRLTYQGYSYDKPIASNNNKEGRSLNRRVEFEILRK